MQYIFLILLLVMVAAVLIAPLLMTKTAKLIFDSADGL